MSRAVIITGFHRSGTSLVAQLLHAAGLFLGEEMIGALLSNPYGHFEDREFVRLHDRILADNGRSWQVDAPLLPVVNPMRWTEMRDVVFRRRAAHARWGFKDPRASLFLHLWKHLLPEARVLAVYRDWADSAYSLERRHAREMLQGLPPRDTHRRFWQVPDLALRMWIEHNQAILRFAGAYPEHVLAVPFESMSRGYPLVRILNQLWQLGLEPTPTAAVFDAAVTTARPRRQPLADTRISAVLRRTWSELDRLAASTPELEEYQRAG